MGEWTWMNGDSTANSLGHFVTQGIFSPSNNPPGLYEACQWTDKEGNFWLFGGGEQGHHNDLWKFNPSINQWAWIKGSGGLVDQPGIYGTQGIPSPTNNPGGRMHGPMSWVDTSGNLWMFGGDGLGSIGDGILGDLWKYTISTNEWTWMKGPDTVNSAGIWGAIDFENSTNNPQARCENNSTWTDSNNNLWLFGGEGSEITFLADLWKYNISTNNWTWIKGPDSANAVPVFGTKGVPDISNNPRVRWCYSAWKAKNDDLWIFGGNYMGNDLWRYHITTKEWTWIGGDSNPGDTVAIGAQCNSLITNIPASRGENRACWTRNCDNFVFFGGGSYAGVYNDLWNYNVSNNEWTLMNGSNYPNQPNHYGIRLVSSPYNIPSLRTGSLGFKDNFGNLWMFGGNGNGDLNDMWRYVPDTSCPHISCLGEGINEHSNSKSEITIYPSPTSGTFTLQYNLSSAGSLRITDVLGREVYAYNLPNRSGQETISLQLGQGIYFWQVLQEHSVSAKGKLVIIK